MSAKEQLAGKHILCVYAKDAAGPGWGNQVLHIICMDQSQTLHKIALQPEEWCDIPAMGHLFGPSRGINESMVDAVEQWRKLPEGGQ